MNTNERDDDASQVPPPAASGTPTPEQPGGDPGSPEADERREWQEELRREADPRSSGSDESPANAPEPASGENGGLHGGLVR